MNKNRKLTPEEIHALAIAPLPTFNIIPNPHGAGIQIFRNPLEFKIKEESKIPVMESVLIRKEE